MMFLSVRRSVFDFDHELTSVLGEVGSSRESLFSTRSGGPRIFSKLRKARGL